MEIRIFINKFKSAGLIRVRYDRGCKNKNIRNQSILALAHKPIGK